MSFAERKGISGATPTQQSPPDPEVFCLHRSWAKVGNIKCSCSNQPEVFGCSEPWVVSGFCMPKGFHKMPASGPIVLEDGKKVTPADERMPDFMPWVLKEGETAADWQVIACSRCPKHQDPPTHVIRLQELHIHGDFDPETGHSDVLHLVPNTKPLPDTLPVPDGMRSCMAHPGRAQLGDLVDATNCRLLIVYGPSAHGHMVKDALSSRPHLKVWFVPFEQQVRREEITGVVYGLPDDLAKGLADCQREAYQKAIERILS